MSRPARALVDTQALRHNLQQVRKFAPASKVMSVIKANGYGHGINRVAAALIASDAFAVTSVEEGIQLRESGFWQPICLLSGFFEPEELLLLDAYALSPVIHHEEQLQQLEAHKRQAVLDIWLKIDTGMYRVGFPWQSLAKILPRLQACRAVRTIRLLSHFADADNPGSEATRKQIDDFTKAVAGTELESSLANSAGVVAWPASHLDWVRPGIMLYGTTPVAGKTARELGLQPVMTLETRLMAVQWRNKGDAIGYGGDWVCPEAMPVGVAAIGYGDGYPRHAKSGTPVLVGGQRVSLIGRVSMDMITLDLRARPEAKPGDRVVLWGGNLPVEEIARAAETISYELFCHVTGRVPFVEVNG